MGMNTSHHQLSQALNALTAMITMIQAAVELMPHG